jgi:biopolymer transport protein ExbD
MKQSIHAVRMARNHRRAKAESKLNLVALMDIFTILVFFLLVNSSEVQVLQVNKSIKLPESVADKRPKDTLVVMVSSADILINGRLIASVYSVLKNNQDQIQPLKTELEYLAARSPLVTDEEKAAGRDIVIMGDAAIPYQLLKKIMTTSAQSGFSNISFAVTQVYAPNPAKAVGG